MFKTVNFNSRCYVFKQLLSHCGVFKNNSLNHLFESIFETSLYLGHVGIDPEEGLGWGHIIMIYKSNAFILDKNIEFDVERM